MQYDAEEPFGERRQDLRQRAVAEILSGVDGVRFDWPYWPPAKSEYEKLVEAQEIARRMKAKNRVASGS